MTTKRDTFMTGPGTKSRPYYPQAPDIEAAKYLRGVAARYVKQQATVGDVEVAITEFRSAVAGKKGD